MLQLFLSIVPSKAHSLMKTHHGREKRGTAKRAGGGVGGGGWGGGGGTCSGFLRCCCGSMT
jgi:hypothetical protein